MLLQIMFNRYGILFYAIHFCFYNAYLNGNVVLGREKPIQAIQILAMSFVIHSPFHAIPH